MTGLKCLEIRQRSAHVHSHKDQPVTRRFFLKAIVPNLLFQNLWHVHGASQSFPQSKPPTSLCSWKQKGGCGLVKPSKQPVWDSTLQINWITVHPHWSHTKLSQKKPEGKWRFLTSELRYLPVSSYCLPFLPGCNRTQHINPSSAATQGQAKINCASASVLLPVKPTALSYKFPRTAQPFFSVRDMSPLLSTPDYINTTTALFSATPDLPTAGWATAQLWALPLPQELWG